jgi:hypothetical protein
VIDWKLDDVKILNYGVETYRYYKMIDFAFTRNLLRYPFILLQ